MEMEGKGEGRKRKDRSLKHHSTLITLPFLLPLTPKRSFFFIRKGFQSEGDEGDQIGRAMAIIRIASREVGG